MRSSSLLSRAGRRLDIALAIVLTALICAACGKSTSATAPPATPSSTHSSSAHAAGATGTSSQTTTTSTTPALPGTGKPPITVGDKNYTEQFVLGQLYAQALTAEGFNVNLNPNIGPTQVTMQALKEGSLSMYPEYLNAFDTSIAGYKRSFHTQLGAFQAAQKFAESHGLQLLPPTPFSDTYGLAVTDAYATENHLHTIGDLRRVANRLTIGGPPQFEQGTPGLPALAAAYGVVPAAFKSMAIGDQYSALNNSIVQAADVGTTDGELATGDYQVLSDPRQMFGWGNVVPVVAGKVIAEEGPAFVAVIERVDATLTTNAMRQMNELVDVAKLNPSDVAKQFLQTHHLLNPSAS